jgi:hypothetical protein
VKRGRVWDSWVRTSLGVGRVVSCGEVRGGGSLRLDLQKGIGFCG